MHVLNGFSESVHQFSASHLFQGASQRSGAYKWKWRGIFSRDERENMSSIARIEWVSSSAITYIISFYYDQSPAVNNRLLWGKPFYMSFAGFVYTKCCTQLLKKLFPRELCRLCIHQSAALNSSRSSFSGNCVDMASGSFNLSLMKDYGRRQGLQWIDEGNRWRESLRWLVSHCMAYTMPYKSLPSYL
jgi:hypothetical protein